MTLKCIFIGFWNGNELVKREKEILRGFFKFLSNLRRRPGWWLSDLSEQSKTEVNQRNFKFSKLSKANRWCQKVWNDLGRIQKRYKAPSILNKLYRLY